MTHVTEIVPLSQPTARHRRRHASSRIELDESGSIQDSDSSDHDPCWKKFLKLFLPHFTLFCMSFCYILLGAYLFSQIEWPAKRKIRDDALLELEKSHKLFIVEMNEMRSDMNWEQAEKKFAEHVDKLWGMHKSKKLRKVDIFEPNGPVGMHYGLTVFFMAAFLTTVGYGNVTPVSEGGRLFCICYGLIGFPLLLMTVADLAKFLSGLVMKAYQNYLYCKAQTLRRLNHICCYFRRVKRRRRHNDSEDGHSPPASPDVDENVVDYLTENLDSVHYVEIPPSLVFVAIILYTCFGGLLLSQYENWTFVEAFYYSFISILMIGFGDFVPARDDWHLAVSFLYVFCGLVITTTCVDIVGAQYIHRLHTLGRKVGDADYLQLLKQSKKKKAVRERRSKAMSTLLETLTMVQHIQPPATPESEDVSRLPSAPTNVRIENITPYSIKLAWEHSEECNNELRYCIRYKQKHGHWRLKEPVQEVAAVSGTEFEITGLQSFSIYEIGIASLNRFGKSDYVRLVQITEPELAPQNILAENVGPKSIRLRWKSPVKKKLDVKNYCIYYTKNPLEPYDRWMKVSADAVRRAFTLSDLDENITYAFSVAANYRNGHSPFSRQLFANTTDMATETIGEETNTVETVQFESWEGITTPQAGSSSIRTISGS